MTAHKTNDISKLSRIQLARLGREYMAAAQFNSRCGYAAVRINHGEEAYLTVAIDNWMAASPTYARRMQKAMGFTGNTVETIFKGLQLECGFSHQYFDVHFELSSPEQGRFWLQSCGPLLETEPRGDDAVKIMCHDVEDPTFDATAVATNPLARMRPVHRPPRPAADRENSNKPHCEWNVFIDHSAEPLEEIELTRVLAQSQLAQLDIPRPAEDLEPGGLYDYSGPLQEQLHLEQLSHSALVLVCKELALQNHLLVKALAMVVQNHYGSEAASAVGAFQMVGSTWAMAERLSRWSGHDNGGIDAIVDVLQVHPLFQPAEYQPIDIKRNSDDSITLSVPNSIASEDTAQPDWLNLPEPAFTEGLSALVQGVDLRAVCEKVNGQENSWQIRIDPSVDTSQVDIPLPVQVAKSTVLYQTKFRDRIQLVEQL